MDLLVHSDCSNYLIRGCGRVADWINAGMHKMRRILTAVANGFLECVRRQCDDGDVDDDVEEVQRVISDERSNESKDDGGGRMRTKVEGGIRT